MIRRKNLQQLELTFEKKKPVVPAPAWVGAPKPAPAPVGADRSTSMVLSASGWFMLEPKLTTPRSRATGGALNAVEAWRAMCGYSLELAGLLAESGAYCSTCTRFLFFNPRSRPLFEAAREDGRRLPGEEFSCSRCNQKFNAHRGEKA